MSPVCGSFPHEYLSDIKDANAREKGRIIETSKMKDTMAQLKLLLIQLC